MRIRKILDHNKITSGEIKFDSILMYKPENILYLLGFKLETVAYLLIPDVEFKRLSVPKFFVTELDYEMVVSKLKDLKIRDKIDVVKILIGQENIVSEEIKRLKRKGLNLVDIKEKLNNTYNAEQDNSNSNKVDLLANQVAEMVKTAIYRFLETEKLD